MNPELDTFTNALLVIVIAFFAILILVGLTIKVVTISIISIEKSHALRVQNANTGSVRSGAFGYHFCRFSADKEDTKEK